jgi:hypothetical protein
MRKRLTFALIGAMAIAVAAATTASAVLTAPDGNTQSIAVKITPKKLSKTEPTPVTLDVTTKTTSTTNPNGTPVPAVRAVVDFDKNTAIFSKGYPTCEAGKLQSTSTEIALEACKKAKVGGGTATAFIPVGKQVFVENLTVTAFNGKPQGNKPVILLHAYGSSPVQTTQVLEGTVSRYDKQGYGPRLDIKIPLIAGGQGALTEFHATIFKKFKYKGKLRSYVTAMCKTKKLKSRGEFIFKDGETLTPTVTNGCTQKK